MVMRNQDLLTLTSRKGYAIGASKVSNLESALAVAEASAEEKSPAIVAVTPSAIKYTSLSHLARLVRTAAGSLPVRMSLHLDHEEDVETASNTLPEALPQ
jgi:fructose/tagatose bisphosphate aldolase